MIAQCTSDEWADFVSSYRTVQTEEQLGHGVSLMHSKLKYTPGFRIATVRYEPNGTRTYFIDKAAADDGERVCAQNRMFPR